MFALKFWTWFSSIWKSAISAISTPTKFCVAFLIFYIKFPPIFHKSIIESEYRSYLNNIALLFWYRTLTLAWLASWEPIFFHTSEEIGKLESFFGGQGLASWEGEDMISRKGWIQWWGEGAEEKAGPKQIQLSDFQVWLAFWLKRGKVNPKYWTVLSVSIEMLNSYSSFKIIETKIWVFSYNWRNRTKLIVSKEQKRNLSYFKGLK